MRRFTPPATPPRLDCRRRALRHFYALPHSRQHARIADYVEL
jgi:hypothetical protein